MNKPVRAKKSLGQNFLVDPNYQRKIVAALDPQPADRVIEIGPGTGALTDHIVGRVAHFTAIELDDQLAASLQQRYGTRADFELIHRDVLAVDLGDVANTKVVGNIPYNITSPLIFKLLARAARPRQLVLMVQKEVADRIVAPAGHSDYGALTVGVQSVANVERLFVVPRGAFRPVPNVDSAVVRIMPHQPPTLSATEEVDLRALTRAAFSWRRKQLQNILRNADGFGLGPEQIQRIGERTGLRMTDRPEQLTPADFITLAGELRALGYPTAPASE
ncbi:MAG: 16S rRNA (adenine(1518)-N(6)/adenine(1519)-N(6))-dimethyltransferase RsmA [Gemmatimonadota bacterium]